MFQITMLPADDGDCFLIETGPPPHRILVDGGRAATARGPLAEVLATLPSRAGPTVDLMVLTHFDADHIEGLLDLIQAPPRGFDVGEVWFNGYNQTRIAAGKPSLRLPRAAPRFNDAQRGPTAVLSAGQATAFEAAVRRAGWRWNTSLPDGAAMVGENAPLPSVTLSSGAKLTLLGPPRHKLAALLDKWSRVGPAAAEVETAVLGRGGPRAPTAPTLETMASLAIQRDHPDESPPNGASITFALEHLSRSAVFGADAHPEDFASGLVRYSAANRSPFDAIKTPHHGSAANNTSALLEVLRGRIWLISTDGSRHGLPDPEALARIVMTPGADKRLVFNSRNARTLPWAAREITDAFGFRAEFPPADNAAVVIDLEEPTAG